MSWNVSLIKYGLSFQLAIYDKDIFQYLINYY